MDFKNYMKRFEERLILINNLFDKKELCLSFDKLKSENKVDHEILYFKHNGDEDTGIFIFGFKFFLQENKEQEFKKILGQNTLNFKIYKAYKDLKKSQNKIKVTDILNHIQNERKDSLDLHKYLRRILTLAYYFNWDLVKDKKDLEGDQFIQIPDKFLIKVTQRFNFDIAAAIYENDDLMMFMNSRGKMNVVLKDLDCFTKSDIEKLLIPTLKKVFQIKKINIEN